MFDIYLVYILVYSLTISVSNKCQITKLEQIIIIIIDRCLALQLLYVKLSPPTGQIVGLSNQNSKFAR